MVRVHLVICFVFLSLSIAKIFHGFKHYTTYKPGRMGIIITAPHGGTLDPKFQENGNIWPLRTNGCENALGECVWRHVCKKTSVKCLAKTLVDEYTRKIAGDIADEIELLTEITTGLRPHVVYNNLKRRKLDANREINQAAFGIPDAILAYNDYTRFIAQAKASITGSGLLLDIHGQTHRPPGGQWIELGYLLTPQRLYSGQFWKSLTSINFLGKRLCGMERNLCNPCFKDLLRGYERSLGHFMNVVGLRAVPSPEIPFPGDPKLYYKGGFTTEKHGSKQGGHIDAIQLELPRELRENWPRDKVTLVSSLMCFFVTNYNTELTLKAPLVCPKTRPSFEETENVASFSKRNPYSQLQHNPAFEERENSF